MTSRKELLLALGLSTVGGLLLLLAVSRPWVTWEVNADLTLEPVRRTTSGAALRPELSAFAVIGLAGVVAQVATTGWWRRLLGAVLLATGVLVLLRALTAANDATGLAYDALALAGGCLRQGCAEEFVASASTPALGPVLAAAGGAALLAAGLLTVVRGGRWPKMGAAYQPPGAAAVEPVGDKAVWDALDRGDDPTA